jgi:hypothetical protein
MTGHEIRWSVALVTLAFFVAAANSDHALRAAALGPTGRIMPDVVIVSKSSAVAEDLIRHAACPVLFVPTTGERKDVRR